MQAAAITGRQEPLHAMARLMGVRGVPAVLLAVALLAACGGEQASDERGPASVEGSVVAPNAGFGGVVEVKFSTDVATAEDALARDCGLTGGERGGLATAPLPPSSRWYPEPPDAGAAVACMRRQESVLRASLPR